MYEYYILSFLAILVCGLLCGIASAKVSRAYKAYGKIATRSHTTGYETARKLLNNNDVADISIGRVRGHLTDHYHPTKRIVNLSEGVYGSDSVAAVAVAAHEIGHVMQKKKGYFFYKVRTALVPITNFGSRLAVPLVLVGLLLDIFVGMTENYTLGYTLAMIGVALYGLSALFALVTLPVEFDASRRAKKMLVQEGILTDEELPYADKMLDAAAMTYVASLLTSVVYFLRFLLWVLLLFGGRRRR